MEVPKQFVPVAGKPVIMHTIRAFYEYFQDIQIILTIRSHDVSYWKKLCLQYDFRIEHTVVKGGKTRFQSVKNGLLAIQEEGYIAIHDAVRPLVENKLITESFRLAMLHGAAVPVIPVNDTIREITGNFSTIIDRSHLQIVQTPQTFHTSLIREAYRQEYHSSFTDDAAVAEATGLKVHYFPGQINNIKITRREDLLFVDALLRVGEGAEGR